MSCRSRERQCEPRGASAGALARREDRQLRVRSARLAACVDSGTFLLTAEFFSWDQLEAAPRFSRRLCCGFCAKIYYCYLIRARSANAAWCPGYGRFHWSLGMCSHVKLGLLCRHAQLIHRHEGCRRMLL